MKGYSDKKRRKRSDVPCASQYGSSPGKKDLPSVLNSSEKTSSMSSPLKPRGKYGQQERGARRVEFEGTKRTSFARDRGTLIERGSGIDESESLKYRGRQKVRIRRDKEVGERAKGGGRAKEENEL